MNWSCRPLVIALLCALALPVFSQAPLITSFNQNGFLVCSNLTPGSVASVEWASSLNGPWKTNWQALQALTVGPDGTIQASVPMFYRVRQIQGPLNMALIPAGSFQMGDTFAEGNASERPTHIIYLSAFYMDKFEVTKALWNEVKAWNGGNGFDLDTVGDGRAANHPVHSANWYDVVKWCNARSQTEGLIPCYYTDTGLTTIYKTGEAAPYVNWNANGYRLPTEAEWEKAARAGASGQRFPWSDGDTIQHTRANYHVYQTGGVNYYAFDTSSTSGFHPDFDEGQSPYTNPVGYFAANAYGLYDMAGNLWEWCWDWHSNAYYSTSPPTDPRGPSSGSYRVIRGGSYDFNAGYCRAAMRGNHSPANRNFNVSFRCVRPAA